METEHSVAATDTLDYAKTGEYEYAAPLDDPAQLDVGGWESSDPAYGYDYDPATGEYAYTGGGEGGEEASFFALDEATPTSPFGDAAYWQQYGEEQGGLVDEIASAEYEQFEIPDPGQYVDGDGGAVLTEPHEEVSQITIVASDSTLAGSPPSRSPGTRRRKQKGKTKEERRLMRQELLEKAEEQKDPLQSLDGDATTAGGLPTKGRVTTQSDKRVESRPPTFLERERAKFRLGMRIARAIGRKRIPVQTRILTEASHHQSPMEIYFGGSLEPALSDIFWASMKGDLRRVRFLVEVEAVSASNANFDPWNMEQTPLHWAAKGGSAGVVEYLLLAGANPRSLDENGSMPLHLACWAGHVDATLALLRATDTKDLYVQDYDAAFSPLDWALIRGHTQLVKAIERYEDSKWLPKLVDDLIRGIVRYKIKLYKENPKSPKSPTRLINLQRQSTSAST